MERRAGLVVVNLLEPGPAEREPASHRELPIAAIGRHAAASGLRSYEIHHGRSHLVAYEPGHAASARAPARAAGDPRRPRPPPAARRRRGCGDHLADVRAARGPGEHRRGRSGRDGGRAAHRSDRARGPRPARAHGPRGDHQLPVPGGDRRPRPVPAGRGRGAADDHRVRPVGPDRHGADHARVAQADRDRRQVRAAGRGRPGGRVPEGVHARARLQRDLLRDRLRRLPAPRGALRPHGDRRPRDRARLVAGVQRRRGADLGRLPPDAFRPPARAGVDRPAGRRGGHDRARDRGPRLLEPGARPGRRQHLRRDRRGRHLAVSAAAALRRGHAARVLLLLLAAPRLERQRAGDRPGGGPDRQLHRRPRRARGARAGDHLLDVRRPPRLADPADDLPGGVRGQGPHRAALRGVREVEPAGADVGVSVRGLAGAVRARPDQLRARRALARGGGPAAGVRAHDRRSPGRLQLGDLLLGDRQHAAARGLELRPARGLRRGHRAADDRLRPRRLRRRDGDRRPASTSPSAATTSAACSRAFGSGATWCARSPRPSSRRSRSSPCGR